MMTLCFALEARAAPMNAMSIIAPTSNMTLSIVAIPSSQTIAASLPTLHRMEGKREDLRPAFRGLSRHFPIGETGDDTRLRPSRYPILSHLTRRQT